MFSDDDSEYNGEWKDSMKEGYGKYKVASDEGFDFYVGDFKADKYHGKWLNVIRRTRKVDNGERICETGRLQRGHFLEDKGWELKS